MHADRVEDVFVVPHGDEIDVWFDAVDLAIEAGNNTVWILVFVGEFIPVRLHARERTGLVHLHEIRATIDDDVRPLLGTGRGNDAL